MKRVTITLVVVLVTLFMGVGVTSSTPYDAWYDFDDDGDIDIYDIVDIAGRYGTTGTPINKTELLLELAARIDALNATLMSHLENPTYGTLKVVSDSFAGATHASAGTLVVSFPASSFAQAPEILYCRVVLKEASGAFARGTVVYANILSVTKDNFEIEVVEEKGSYTTVNGIDVDVVYLAIGTEPSEPQSNCLTIGPTAFTPDLPRLQAFWKTRYAVGGSGSSYASVRLPDGVQIINVTARLEDFYNDAQVSVGLHRVNITGPSETSDSLATIDSGTSAQLGDVILYDDTIDHTQIDNEHFYYVVELYLNYEASDLNLHWVQVTYEH